MSYLAIAAIGLAIGSFINAYSYRLARGQSVWRGRSVCPACGEKLTWRELIPVFSFLAQKGRCRRCQAIIPRQYLLVETAAAILFVFFYSRTAAGLYHFWDLAIILFVGGIFIFLFIHDLNYGELPDQITLPAIGIFLLFYFLKYFEILKFKFIWNLEFGIWNLFAAAAIGGGFFFSQYFISRGRWVGGGDIRLGVLTGLILGWPKILLALFLAYVAGAAAVLPMVWLKKKTLKSSVPFGIFLIPAAFIAWQWGQKIIDWYFEKIKI